MRFTDGRVDLECFRQREDKSSQLLKSRKGVRTSIALAMLIKSTFVSMSFGNRSLASVSKTSFMLPDPVMCFSSSAFAVSILSLWNFETESSVNNFCNVFVRESGPAPITVFRRKFHAFHANRATWRALFDNVLLRDCGIRFHKGDNAWTTFSLMPGWNDR